jgi:hypothetical protein
VNLDVATVPTYLTESNQVTDQQIDDRRGQVEFCPYVIGDVLSLVSLAVSQRTCDQSARRRPPVIVDLFCQCLGHAVFLSRVRDKVSERP